MKKKKVANNLTPFEKFPLTEGNSLSLTVKVMMFASSFSVHSRVFTSIRSYSEREAPASLSIAPLRYDLKVILVIHYVTQSGLKKGIKKKEKNEEIRFSDSCRSSKPNSIGRFQVQNGGGAPLLFSLKLFPCVDHITIEIKRY